MNASKENIKLSIMLAPNIKEADRIINENYHFETIGEKIAFLKGMFGIERIGNEQYKPDEMTYWTMLNVIQIEAKNE